MDTTSLTTSNTVTTTSSTPTSKRSNEEIVVDTSTTTSTTIIQPSILLVPTVTPPPPPPSLPSSPPLTIVETDYITAVGLCGVNGYEAEVNHTIGLCREARTDHHLLLTVTKCRTGTNTLVQKNRLMYACLTANIRWFRTLFRMTSKSDIVNLRTRQNETLYHLVCTLPKAKFNGITLRYEESPTVPDRLQILNTLFTTKIDINVKTNTTKKQIAFDIVTDDSKAFPDDNREQLLRWWLDHNDRLDIENRNRCLPWLAYDNRLEDIQRLCRMESIDLNVETAHGNTALTLACREGHTEVLAVLLTYYPHRLTNLNHQDMGGATAVYEASQYNHLAIVQILCRHADINLNLPNNSGDTALMMAAHEGHISVVEELLTYYPHRLTNLNHQCNYGWTALYYACSYNHLATVQALCRHPEVNLNLADINRSTGFTVAAVVGHTSIVEALLTYYPHRLTNLNHQDKYGSTALYSASENNRLATVQALCRHPDVDLNIADIGGATALMIAAQHGHTSIVEALLPYYPHRLTNLNHQDQGYDTALHLACRSTRLATVQALCRHPDVEMNLADWKGFTPLITAARKGRTSIVDELLTYYPHRLTNLNHQDKYGNTALHQACYNNNLATVQTLCRHADLDMYLPNNDGAIALMLAIEEGHTSIVDAFLTIYPLNHQINNGGTILHYACFGQLEIVRTLCRHPDVNLNIADWNGSTPLMIATECGYTSIVEELLTYYPHRLTNLNHQNNDGDTALHLACTENYLDTVQTLCRHPDVNLNIADWSGSTPLMIATECGYTSILEELLTYYPHRLTNLNHQNKYGNTALFLACTENHLDTVQALCRHADIDLNLADNEYGKSPLYIAAEKGYTDILATLLQYVPHRRVDINQRANDGTSPMGIARRKGNTELIDTLRNHGGLD